MHILENISEGRSKILLYPLLPQKLMSPIFTMKNLENHTISTV